MTSDDDVPEPQLQPLPEQEVRTEFFHRRHPWLTFGICVAGLVTTAQLWTTPWTHASRHARLNRWLSGDIGYPAMELASHSAGRATIRCDVIDASGYAHGCRTIDATQHDFGAAVLRFIQAARFHPALRNGQPVPENGYSLHVNFVLPR